MDNMFSGVFEGIEFLIKILAVLCIIFVPLGIWKLVDIGIWLYHHVHVHMS